MNKIFFSKSSLGSCINTLVAPSSLFFFPHAHPTRPHASPGLWQNPLEWALTCTPCPLRSLPHQLSGSSAWGSGPIKILLSDSALPLNEISTPHSNSRPSELQPQLHFLSHFSSYFFILQSGQVRQGHISISTCLTMCGPLPGTVFWAANPSRKQSLLRPWR